jgi:hypothetical protein
MEKPDIDHIEGPVAGDLDRAEIDLAQPALHRRHHHRDLRLPAPALRPRRHAALPGPRHFRWKRRPSARWSTSWRWKGTIREQRYMLLAPVVRERKGEHLQVFDQLRAQGYVRVRVDGTLHEIDAVPPLALRQKHTIEAVSTASSRAPTSSSASPNPSRPR